MDRDDYPHFFYVMSKIRITDGQAIIDAARGEIAALLEDNPGDDLLTSELEEVSGDAATALGWLLSTTRAEFVTNNGFIVEDGSERYSHSPNPPEWWPRS
jgi:hypothetical protein